MTMTPIYRTRGAAAAAAGANAVDAAFANRARRASLVRSEL